MSAIRQNHENALAAKRQRLLEMTDKSVTSYILNHMIRTIQQCDVPLSLIAQWMDSAKLTDQERKNVQEAVDKKASR
jgi:ribosome maturation protein Sdo1